jgi:hypothetical protein
MSAADVRDEVSSATDLTSTIGTREARTTLRTLFFDATHAPGATRRPSILWYSITGISAASALASLSMSAQRAGAASDKNRLLSF